MPDEYHVVQAILLRETFRPPAVASEEVFSAVDINLYYDVRQPRRCKRPDWFGVVGVPRLSEGTQMRSSYVYWQEGIGPLIVVELLSPKTEKEDLGQTLRDVDGTPTKWEVYERLLRVSYYVAFDGDTNRLFLFQRQGDSFQRLPITETRLWMPSAGLGIGLWQGKYEGLERLWLRFYDQEGIWIPTKEEQVAATAQKADKLAAKLRELGLNPDEI